MTNSTQPRFWSLSLGTSALLVAGVLIALAVASPDLTPRLTDEPLDDRRIVDNLDFDKVSAILRQEGFAVREVINDDGDFVFSIEGTTAVWVFYGGGESVSIVTSWTRDGTNASMERINLWNRNFRYSRAYMDQDSDPVLQLDLDLAKGVTVGRVKDFIATARQSVSTFRREVLE